MSTNIRFKRSDVPGKVPSLDALELGELAINSADGKLFTKQEMKPPGGLAAIQKIVEIGATAVPNVLYVSKGGDDSNSGKTLGESFASLKKALSIATPGTTIFLKSGEYIEDNPLRVPARVSVVGDNLRNTTVRPKNPTKDVFWVYNGAYIFCMNFKGHIAPSAAVCFPPDGSAGEIVTSPYTQAVTSITTTGTGMRVDGAVTTGLRSMVCDAYTQYNQGGIGIHMLNRGNTQLVSIFTICCDISFLCESGGFCSVNLSNSSFGNYGLVSRGASQILYRGVVKKSSGRQITFKNLAKRPNIGDGVLFANYNQATCNRDNGLIVDSLAFDLLHEGTTQSTFAGLRYWAKDVSEIEGQGEETVAAIDFAQKLVKKIVNKTYDPATERLQLVESPSIPSSALAPSSQRLINDEFSIVSKIVKNGPISPKVIINADYDLAEPEYKFIREQVLERKSSIQDQTIAFVKNTFPSLRYAESKCYRDVGLLIDAVINDAVYDTNYQTIKATRTYLSITNNLVIPADTKTATIEAVKFARDKVIALTTEDAEFAKRATANFKIITDALADAGSVTPGVSPSLNGLTLRFSVYPDTDPTVNNLVVNLQANKLFIQKSVIQYINDNYPELRTSYSTDICERDIGYTLDAVCYDLAYGGNAETLDAAKRYYSYANGSKQLPEFEFPATVDAYGRVQLLSQRVVILDPIQSSGLGVSQIFAIGANDLVPTTQTQVNRLGGLFQLFLKQIEREIVATSDFIQSNGAKLNDAELDTAYDTLQANKSFIKAEVIAYLTESYPAFAYDRVKCARDIGYIIDSVCFDITHGGNRQIVQAGIYYYGFNDKSNVLKSVLPKQINQTVNAYLYLKELLADVITCNPTPNPWQGVVPQRTDYPAATASESSAINNLIDVIVEILREGPNNSEDSVQRARQAISLTATTDTNKIRAFKLLLANREFIQAELKAYININWYEISDGDTEFARVSKATELTLGTTTTGYPVTTYQPASLKAIRDSILAAKEDIKTETIKFMANSFFDNFSFNKPKCYRDVGLILDAILSDMVFDSNYKTITAAASYFRAYASDVIGPQKVQTIASLEATKVLTLERVVTPAAKKAIATRFDILLDIIKNGTVTDPFATAPAITYPPVLRNSDEDIERKQALTILRNNIGFIKDEIADFVDANFTLMDYDREKCARDVSLIIDALSWDLMFGSNFRAITAGRSYQRVDAVKVVKNQKLATVGAFKQLKKLLAQAVKSNTLAVNSLQRGMDIIINIVESNGKDVPKFIVPFPTAGRDVGYKRARDLVEKNREFIVGEVLAFINAGGKTGNLFDVPLGYDEAKCERDLNLILDAVYYDITYGGTLESEVAARSYFVGALSQLDPSGNNADEVTATLAAYDYLKDVLALVAVDSAVSRTAGNTTVQLRSPTGSDGNAQAAADMVSLVKLIRLYIAGGNASTGAVAIAGAVSQPDTKWVDPALVDQYKVLQRQKVSLKDTIVDFVNTNYVIFGYDRDTCARDVGLVIDAVRYDMMFDSNFQSITAGRSYWRAQASVVRDDQKVATLAAFELLKTKLLAVVTNNNTAKLSVTASMDAILAIIDRGLTAAPAIKWTRPTVQTSETGLIKTNAFDNAYFTARGVIQANKETVVSEINQWVIDRFLDATYAGDGFTYGAAQQANCQRDLRFIIDAISYDLTYGGTMQSDIAARAYKSGIGAQLSVLVSGDLNVTRDAYLELATNLKNRITGADVKTRVDDLVKRIAGIIGNTVSSATTPAPTDWVEASLKTLGDSTLSGSLNNVAFKNATKSAITSFVDANYAYNKDKCKRDVGYLLDAMCYDLLYGGNVDTVSAAQSYFNGAVIPQSTIPKEIIQTVAAYERLKDVIQDVVQLRDVVPSSNKFVATERIIANMDLVNRILDSGESVAPTRPWALPLPTGGATNASTKYTNVAGYLNARNLIEANREFVKAEAIAYITKYKSDNSLTFTYNEEICKRDIDYILDAIYYDMTYGGNLQTRIAAQAYYPGAAALGAGQKVATVALFARLANILEDLGKGNLITKTTGNAVVQKRGDTSPNQQKDVTPFTASSRAKTLMTIVKSYVDDDTTLAGEDAPDTNWVDSGLRSVSTLINLINSNTYTVNGTTFDGIRKKVTDYVTANYSIQKSVTATETTNDTITAVDHGLIPGQVIVFRGTVSGTGLIADQSYYVKTTPSVDTFTVSTTRTGAAVNLTTNASVSGLTVFDYNVVACARDVGLILDAVRYDLLFGTNFASTVAGRAYYRKAGNLVGDGLASLDQKEASLSSLRLAKSLVLEAVIANTPLQNKAGISGSSAAALEAYAAITLAYAAIDTDAAPTATPPTNTELAWVDADLIAISTAMNSANTNTGSGLQKQITDHIALNFSSNSLVNATADTNNLITADVHGLVPGQVIVFEGDVTGTGLTALTIPYYVLAAGFTDNAFKVSTTKNGTPVTLTTNASVTGLKISNYNVNSCQRDVGYVIDAVRYDMMFDSNFRTITAARSYYRAQAALVVGLQKDATVSSFELLKEKLVALASGNQTAKDRVTARMDLFLNILDRGLEVIPEFELPSPTGYNTATYKENYGNSRNLINANREFFKVELTKKIINPVDGDPTLQYDVDTCLRDVDYILDAVCYDLTYGGKMESANAARAYYQGTAPADSLPNAAQKTATKKAFAYLRDLVKGVATNQDLSPIQVKVPQVFGPKASSVAAQASRNLAWSVRDYISTTTPDPIKTYPDLSWLDGVAPSVTTRGPIESFATLLGKYKTNNLVSTTADTVIRIGLPDQLTKYSILNLGGKAVSELNDAANLITVTAHGLSIGDVVVFEGTGVSEQSGGTGGITGLTADVQYFVLADGFTTDTFKVSASRIGSTVVEIRVTSSSIANMRINNYNVTKCKRDIALVLDAVRFDMAFNTNFKTIVAARSYLRNQARAILGNPGSPARPDQKAASKQLFEKMRDILQALCQAPTTTLGSIANNVNGGGGGEVGITTGPFYTRITKLMNLVIDTIDDEDESNLPAKPYSLPLPTGLNTALGTPVSSFNKGYLNARNAIEINREFIKSEVIAWIDDQTRKGVNGFNSNLDGDDFTYSRTTCLRDLDYLLDGIYYDLTYGGNTETVNTGASYYAGLNDTEASLANADAYASEQAYDFLGRIILDITRNVPVDSVQTIVPQIRGVAGGEKAAQTLAILSDTVIDIVKGGVKQIPERVDPDFLAGDETLAYVRSSLQEQKKNLQARIADYIDSYILQYNTEKCARDVGLIVDCVMYDLVLNSNFQTITAGSVYLQKAANVVTSYQIGPQLEAVRFIRDKCIEISKTPPLTENLTAIAEINNRFDILYDIIDKGVEAAPPVVNVPPQGAAYNPNAINAAKSIIANKEFLKEEATAYITANYKTYDQSRCARDVGLIIDAALFDLLLGTNYNSIKAGLAYRRATSSLVIDAQLPETLGGIDFALRRVVALTDDATAISSITSSFELIKSIISKGSIPITQLPLAGGSVYALPRASGKEFRNTAYFSAVTAIRAAIGNTKTAISNFIIEELAGRKNVAFSGFDYGTWNSTLNTNTVGDQTVAGTTRRDKCETDIEYILEALCYDLTYGGNMETVNAGKAYYAGTTSPSLLGAGTEVAATYEAYTFLAKYISKVVLASVSSNVAVEAERLILGIRNLIDAGQNDSPTIVEPDLTWVSTNRPEYVTLDGNILTDKEVLKTEIINFINSNKSDYSLTGSVGDVTTQLGKCNRDLGYILDAVFYDAVIGSNYQSVTAGLAYRRLDASNVLTVDQRLATIRALQKAKLLVLAVTLGGGGSIDADVTARLKANLTTVIDLISDTGYDTSAPDLVFTNNLVTTTTDQKAAAIGLQANKTLIKNSIVRWFTGTSGTQGVDYYDGGTFWSNLSQDKRNACTRDIGFIIDALTYDILYGGGSNGCNWASVINARAYFAGTVNQLDANGDSPAEVTATSAAYEQLKNVLRLSVVDEQAVTPIPILTPTLRTRAGDLINIIKGVIDAGNTNSLPSISLPPLTGLSTARADSLTALNAAKATIKSSTLAYIQVTPSEFDGFDEAKCARDVGYMIDAVRYDLLFGTNFRSHIAGRSYRRAAASIVREGGSQFIITYAAITHLKSLMLGIVVNNAAVLISASAQARLNANFEIIRQFLQGDYTVSNTPALPATFGDITGTISAIDGVPTTTRLVTVGSTIGIVPGTILTKVSGVGTFGTNPQITNINSDTTFTITADTVPTVGSIVFTVQGDYSAGGNTDAEKATAKLNVIKAKANIVTNKAFIKAEVLAYINQEKTADRGNFKTSAYPNFVFDANQEAACTRDLGFILDAFIYDLTYGGNLETTVAGSAYYNGTALAEGEKLGTLDAYKHLRDIIAKVATGAAITKTVTNTQSYTAGTAGSSDEITALVNLVIAFIDACPIDPRVVTPNTDWVASKLFVFSDALNEAKATVATTTTDYVKANFPILGTTFVNKCQRDIGLVIDAVRYDMMFNSNFRTIVAARSYYRSQASRVLGEQKVATLAAFGIVKTALQDIVKADTTAYNRVGASLDLLIDIIDDDNNIPAFTIPYGGTVSSFDSGYLAARDRIEVNRDYIKAQVSAYITANSINPTGFSLATCLRDVDYFLDAVRYDLTYGGNLATVEAGRAYYEGTVLNNGGSAHILATYNTFNFVKGLIKNIAKNLASGSSYTVTPAQSTTGLGGSDAGGDAAEALFADLLTFIDNDLTTVVASTGGQFTCDTTTKLSLGATVTITGTLDTGVGKGAISGYASGNVYKVSATNNSTTFTLTTPAGVALTTTAGAITGVRFSVSNAAEKLPNTSWVNSNFVSFATSMDDNKVSLETQVTDYIDANFPAPFTYNKDKCARDVGLVIDAVRYDMMFDNNFRTYVAGRAYYRNVLNLNADALSNVNGVNQKAATLAAFTFLKTKLLEVVTGNAEATKRVTSAMRTLLDTLELGETTRNSYDSLVSTAVGLLDANRTSLLADMKQYLIDIPDSGFTAPGFPGYSRNTCLRDIGYVIDAIKYDLTYGGNMETRVAGLAYYEGVVLGSGNATHIAATKAAFTELGVKIAAISTFPGSVANRAKALLANVNSLIDDDASITEVYADATWGDVDLKEISATMFNNEVALGTAVTDYVTAKYPGLTYDKVKCARDVGLVTEAVRWDMVFASNFRSIVAGRAYYRQALNLNVDALENLGQKKASIAAFSFLKEKLLALAVGNNIATSRIASNMDVILEILETGLETGEAATVPTLSIPTGTRSDNRALAKDYLLNNTNKNAIVNSVITYINTLNPFIESGATVAGYDEAKCARDVGYIVTAVAYDLVTGSNYQSTIAGLRYLGNAAVNVLGAKEKHMTLLSLRYLKSLLASIVASDNDSVTAVKASMDLIIKIINVGADAVGDALTNMSFTPAVTPPQYANTLRASRSTIRDELSAWFAGSTGGTTYSKGVTTGTRYGDGTFWSGLAAATVSPGVTKQDKCKRDVEYIVDALTYDLTFGGNWATVIAARSYYSGTVSQLDLGTPNTAEVDATLAAYDKLKDIVATRVPNQTSTANALIEIIRTVVEKGLDFLPEIVYPKLLGANNDKSIAKNNLLNSVEVVKTKTIRYINEKAYFQYDSVKCERDLGYILDAVFSDVVTNSNYQSVTAGLSYTRLDAADAVSPPQKFAILAALTHAKTVLADLVSTNDTVVNRIRAKLNIIINIINDAGSAPTLSFTTTNLTGATTTNTLQTDKEAIKTALASWFAGSTGGTTYSQGVTTGTRYGDGTFWSGLAAATLPSGGTKQDKCKRDVGLIIDALTYDLTYGGNWASVINARSYFAGTISQLDLGASNPEEKTATLAAYDKLKDLIAASVPGQTAAANTLIEVIRSYIGGNGTTPALTGITYPTAISTVPTINAAAGFSLTAPYSTLVTAKSASVFAIQEYINNVPYIANGAYDADKCKTDVDTILKAIAWDVMFGTTYRSVKAGQAYLRSYAKTVTSEQKTATIGALYFVKTQLGTYFTNAGDLTTARLRMDDIIDILDRGQVALPVSTDPTVPAIAMPLPTGGADNASTSAYAYAAATVFNNTAFLKAEVRAWIVRNYPELDYDKNTCERDVAYILDALRYDIIYGGNSQTVEAGRAYWEGTSLTLGITPTDPNDPNYLNDPKLSGGEDQKVATIGAYTYLGKLIGDLVLGNIITPLQNIVVKGTSGGASNSTVANRARDLISATTDGNVVGGLAYIVNQTSLATANAAVSVTEPGVTWASATSQAAYTNLTTGGGSATVQTAVVGAISAAYTDQWFVYNQSKCARDLGFIVEALAYDLAYGGNSQTRDCGLQYLYKGGIVIPRGTKGPTLLSIGNDSASSNNTLTKAVYTALSSINATVATDAADLLVNNVYKVLKNGAGAAPALVIPTLTSANTDYKLLRDLVIDNVPAIQDATIMYINETYAGFGYKQETCKRDIGLTLDAVAYDLIYGGNSRTKFAAEQYFSGGRLQIPADSKTATAACFNYLDFLVRLVIKNEYITPFQLFASQDTSNVAASQGEVSNIASLFDAFTDIVTNGYISVVTLDATFKSTVDDNTYATFHQVSQITTTGHTLEWVGTGIDVDSALPYNGGVPIEANEIVSENGGFINFTSTDQKGDFKIGPELTIKRDSGSIVGRAFNKSLLGVITPYILALNE
jgi:hypothetical protein